MDEQVAWQYADRTGTGASILAMDVGQTPNFLRADGMAPGPARGVCFSAVSTDCRGSVRLQLMPWPEALERGGPLAFAGEVRLHVRGPVPAHTQADCLRRVQAALLPHTAAQSGRAANLTAPGALFELHLEVAEAGTAQPQHDGDESYTLVLDAAGAHLRAANRFGLQWAMRALLQCLSGPALQAVAIKDAPRFPWRGVMLDPARRFLPLPSVLDVLEGMAALRLNVLHLHLSDDQGFRLASSRLPMLATTHAQHYSRDDVRRLVAAAAELGIRVVPELDMPGHCQSWLVGYPELAPMGQQWELRKPFGIGRGSLDPTRERTYEFVTELLTEVCELFPDEYVHIGGDEVHPKAWAEQPHILAFMQEQGLADERALQHYFTVRVCGILERLSRRAIAWDEVLGHPLPANLTVQAWRGVAARDRALASGRDVLFSSPYYLDLFYGSETHYGLDPGGSAPDLLRWEDALPTAPGFAPVRRTLEGFNRWTRQAATAASDTPATGRLIGGEACLWGELVDAPVLPQRLFSRLPAIAERLWTQAPQCDARDLNARVASVLPSVFAAAGAQSDPLAVLIALQPRAAWLQPARALLDCLEPLKWYARLLGDDALASRAMGEPDPPTRPYETHTPVDRLVDVLSPESLRARRWMETFARWRQVVAGLEPNNSAHANALLDELLDELRPLLVESVAAAAIVRAAPHDAPEQATLLPLAVRVAQLAEALLAVFDGRAPFNSDQPDIDLRLSAPVGGMFIVFEEAVLPVLHAFAPARTIAT